MELELIDSWMLDKHSKVELCPQSSLNCPCWPWTVNDPPASSSQVTRFIGLHHHAFFFSFIASFLISFHLGLLCISLLSHPCSYFCSHSLPGACIQLVLLSENYSLAFVFYFLAYCASSDCFLSEFRLPVLRMSHAILLPLAFFSMIFFLHFLYFFLTWDESLLLAQLPSSLCNSWVYKSVPPHQYLIKMDLSSSVYIWTLW